MDNMSCNICGAPINESDVFCRKCGTKRKLAAAKKEVFLCPNCGSMPRSGAKFCDMCGVGFGAPGQEQSRPQGKRRKRGCFLKLLLLILLLVGTVAAWEYLKPSAKEFLTNWEHLKPDVTGFLTSNEFVMKQLERFLPSSWFGAAPPDGDERDGVTDTGGTAPGASPEETEYPAVIATPLTAEQDEVSPGLSDLTDLPETQDSEISPDLSLSPDSEVSPDLPDLPETPDSEVSPDLTESPDPELSPDLPEAADSEVSSDTPDSEISPDLPVLPETPDSEISPDLTVSPDLSDSPDTPDAPETPDLAEPLTDTETLPAAPEVIWTERDQDGYSFLSRGNRFTPEDEILSVPGAVIGNRVNVRNIPSTSRGRILRQLNNGIPIEVTRRFASGDERYYWFQILYAGEIIGWVYGEFLHVESAGTEVEAEEIEEVVVETEVETSQNE